jgi:hypothetical protein
MDGNVSPSQAQEKAVDVGTGLQLVMALPRRHITRMPDIVLRNEISADATARETSE